MNDKFNTLLFGEKNRITVNNLMVYINVPISLIIIHYGLSDVVVN